MSFWDSVTTGAQNAAETTKLVSIVRLFCSLFCSFAVSLFARASFAGRNQNATTAKQNSDTRWGDGLERHLERLRSLPPQIFSSLTNDDVSFLFQNYLCRIKQRTKLQAEVMYFEQQIKQIMQNFGVECFPHMEQSNSGLVQQAFLNAQRGIEEYRPKIEEKNREINELNQQIDNVGR